MAQEPISGSTRERRTAGRWLAAVGTAVGVVSIAALALRRREPEFTARWPQPAPALPVAGIDDVQPDIWRQDGPFENVGARDLLRRDPYHAGLRAPDNGNRVA